MHNKKLAKLIFVSSIIITGLTGCVSKPEKVAVAPAPQLPEQRLIVHDLNTEAGKKSMIAAQVDFTNMTGRSLEYVMFKTTAFDAQGKVIPSHKSGRPNAWLRIAGPLVDKSRTGVQRWDKVWAGTEVSCFRIEGAEVIFEDSSVEFYQLDQIEMDLAVLPPALCQNVEESLASNN